MNIYVLFQAMGVALFVITSRIRYGPPAPDKDFVVPVDYTYMYDITVDATTMETTDISHLQMGDLLLETSIVLMAIGIPIMFAGIYGCYAICFKRRRCYLIIVSFFNVNAANFEKRELKDPDFTQSENMHIAFCELV